MLISFKFLLFRVGAVDVRNGTITIDGASPELASVSPFEGRRRWVDRPDRARADRAACLSSKLRPRERDSIRLQTRAKRDEPDTA